MAEINVQLKTPEMIVTRVEKAEQLIYWKLRDVFIDPESRTVTVRFYAAIKGEIVHRSRTLSVDINPDTNEESGFWLDNRDLLLRIVGIILRGFEMEVTDAQTAIPRP